MFLLMIVIRIFGEWLKPTIRINLIYIQISNIEWVVGRVTDRLTYSGSDFVRR